MPSHHPSQAPSKQRRTFRGKGGIKDGNLPPKRKPRIRKRYEHHGDDDEADVGKDDTSSSSCEKSNLENDFVNRLQLESPVTTSEQTPPDGQLYTTATDAAPMDSMEEMPTEEDYDEFEQELHRLCSKVRNVRVSIQSSQSALQADIHTWQHNCLNPVRKCVILWRSILKFHTNDDYDSGNAVHDRHGDDDDDNEHVITDDEHEEQIKECSVIIFELIQMAMQTGPLAGSKAGYFKRCGSEVAQMALSFLNNFLSPEEENDHDDFMVNHLRFSEKQISSITTWIQNAKKASDKDAPPSKSMLKKQNQQKNIQAKKKEVKSKKIAKQKKKKQLDT